MNKQQQQTTWVCVVLFKTEELCEHYYVHDEQATNYTRT
jgi:hypothetical protein